MAVTTIKEEFHRLIDEIKDDGYLTDLFESVAGFARQKSDVLENLSPAELQRLDDAFEQVKNGRAVSDTEMRKKYEKWLTK